MKHTLLANDEVYLSQDLTWDVETEDCDCLPVDVNPGYFRQQVGRNNLVLCLVPLFVDIALILANVCIGIYRENGWFPFGFH